MPDTSIDICSRRLLVVDWSSAGGVPPWAEFENVIKENVLIFVLHTYILVCVYVICAAYLSTDLAVWAALQPSS